MDGGVEQAFAAALGALAVTRILFDVGDQAGIEHARVIMGGINATVEVEIGASEVHTHLCLAICFKACSPCGNSTMFVSLTGATGTGA